MEEAHIMDGNAPAVVLITGVMAAGKSTVAELLATRFPRSVHLRGDVFRRMIVNGRAPITPELSAEDRDQLELRCRLAAKTADTYVEAGFTVVVQDIVLGDFLMDFVSMVASRPLAVVVLAPDVEAVRRREAERPKTGYANGWTVEGLDAAFNNTTPRVGLWLDTSNQTPQETVDEIWARMPHALIVSG